jgi:hypothetical protein
LRPPRFEVCRCWAVEILVVGRLLGPKVRSEGEQIAGVARRFLRLVGVTERRKHSTTGFVWIDSVFAGHSGSETPIVQLPETPRMRETVFDVTSGVRVTT